MTQETKFTRALIVILAILIIFLSYNYFKLLQTTKIISTSSVIIENPATDVAINKNNSSVIPKEPELEKTSLNLSKQDIESIIYEYLMKNPNVIVESTMSWQNKKQQEELDRVNKLIVTKKSLIEDISLIPYIGPKNVHAKVVMFYDYNCHHCKNANIILNEVIELYPNLQVIYHPFPILGSDSKEFAKKLVAVFQLDPSKFKNIHDELMSIDSIQASDVANILAKYNVDLDVKNPKLNSNQVELINKALNTAEEILNSSYSLARDLNIRGVPAFVIDDKLYPGIVNKDQLLTLVNKISYQDLQEKEIKEPTAKSE